MPARALLVVGMMLAFIACEKAPPATPQIRADRDQWGLMAYVGTNPSSTMMILNDGTQNLVLSSVTTAAPFHVLDFTQTAITMNQPGFIRVTFQPPAPGGFDGGLAIDSNAENTPHLVIPLIGTGVDAGS